MKRPLFQGSERYKVRDILIEGSVVQIPSLEITVGHHLWKSVFEYNFQLYSWKLYSKTLFHRWCPTVISRLADPWAYIWRSLKVSVGLYTGKGIGGGAYKRSFTLMPAIIAYSRVVIIFVTIPSSYSHSIILLYRYFLEWKMHVNVVLQRFHTWTNRTMFGWLRKPEYLAIKQS